MIAADAPMIVPEPTAESRARAFDKIAFWITLALPLVCMWGTWAVISRPDDPLLRSVVGDIPWWMMASRSLPLLALSYVAIMASQFTINSNNHMSVLWIKGAFRVILTCVLCVIAVLTSLSLIRGSEYRAAVDLLRGDPSAWTTTPIDGNVAIFRVSTVYDMKGVAFQVKGEKVVEWDRDTCARVVSWAQSPEGLKTIPHLALHVAAFSPWR